jgi:chaperone required for assembly of F1-ATPase
MKRFYKEACSKQHDSGGYAVCLDGQPVKTPGRRLLESPGKDLADAVAGEWNAQPELIDPQSMPLTQLLNTAVDRVRPDRDYFVEAVMAYMDTDLVCYRTKKPYDLAKRQQQVWDPPIKWFCSGKGCELYTTSDLQALNQPVKTKELVRSELVNMDEFRLTVFQAVTSLSGSVVLAFSLIENSMSSREVFDAVHVEENYKAEIYGESFYGKAPQQERREEAVLRDLEAAEKFLNLLYDHSS